MSQYELGFLGACVGGFLAYPAINFWAPKRWMGWYLLVYLTLVCLAGAAVVYHHDVVNAER